MEEWPTTEQDRWIAGIKKALKEVKSRLQGKIRSQRKEAIEGYVKKRRAHFDAGRVGIMVDNVFGRRMGLGVIGEVLQPDGQESVGSEEVTTTLHDHFKAQFASVGSHWHEDKEVDRAMRALSSDSHAGGRAREIILQGVWPEALGDMVSPVAKTSEPGEGLFIWAEESRVRETCFIRVNGRSEGSQTVAFLYWLELFH